MRLLIDGLARTGTTTIARILAEHPQVSVVIEPFHPTRYGGVLHRMAMASGESEDPFRGLWERWNAAKHVWGSRDCWPFLGKAGMQEKLWRSATQIIAVHRRNHLQRYVSTQISRNLRYWIGKREGFESRLRACSLPAMDVAAASAAVAADQAALAHREVFLQSACHPHVNLFYEDFFVEKDRSTHFLEVNSLLQNCGLEPFTQDHFDSRVSRFFDRSEFKWCTEDAYERIPEIHAFDDAMRPFNVGCLFC